MKNIIKVFLILIFVLIIAIGIYIYDCYQPHGEPKGVMWEENPDDFNMLYVKFEGNQSGRLVRALIMKLGAKAEVFADEKKKVPEVIIKDRLNKDTESEIYDAIYQKEDSDELKKYKLELNKINNGIELKHIYNIEFIYGNDGYISQIEISYGE